MNDRLADILKQLEKRATKLDGVVEHGKVHRAVLASVQRAAGSIRLCAVLLTEMHDAVLARAHAEDARRETALKAKRQLARLTEWTVYLTQWGLATDCERLMEAIQLIAVERDADAYKALGKQAVETLVKIGMMLSGIELLKLVEEFISSAMDVYHTGESMKFRENQVRLASNLLLWLDSVSMICMTWSTQAQSLILRAEGKYEATSDDQIIEMVVNRTLALATGKQ